MSSASDNAAQTPAAPGEAVYIALGSNLGDREKTLRSALEALGGHSAIRVVRASTFHETEPVGGPPGQGPFLNAAAELQTTLSPAALLHVLQQIERRFHRRRTVRNASRTLDLDLLLFGQRRIHTPDLIVPHPRMAVRAFVLEPLREIRPSGAD